MTLSARVSRKPCEGVGFPIERPKGEDCLHRADLPSNQSRTDELPGIGRTSNVSRQREPGSHKLD
jgi:hypothetical protein